MFFNNDIFPSLSLLLLPLLLLKMFLFTPVSYFVAFVGLFSFSFVCSKKDTIIWKKIYLFDQCLYNYSANVNAYYRVVVVHNVGPDNDCRAKRQLVVNRECVVQVHKRVYLAAEQIQLDHHERSL